MACGADPIWVLAAFKFWISILEHEMSWKKQLGTVEAMLQIAWQRMGFWHGYLFQTNLLVGSHRRITMFLNWTAPQARHWFPIFRERCNNSWARYVEDTSFRQIQFSCTRNSYRSAWTLLLAARLLLKSSQWCQTQVSNWQSKSSLNQWSNSYYSGENSSGWKRVEMLEIRGFNITDVRSTTAHCLNNGRSAGS